MRDPNNLLLGQADGTFVEGAEEAGIVSFQRARGGAVVDLNLDGLLDLVVVNRVEPVIAVAQRRLPASVDEAEPMGTWIAIRLRQPAPNVDAIGSWVEVRVGDRTLVHEVTVGGGHAGGQLGWLHFGLGDAGRGRGSRSVARRRGRPVDGGGRRQFRDHRARCDGGDAVEPGGGAMTLATRRAVLADVELPASGCRSRSRCFPASHLRRAAGTLADAHGATALRPPRRVGRPRTQRQPRLPHRIRPTFRGGGARRLAWRRSGPARRQRELGHRRRGSAPAAVCSLPGSQPAWPAAGRIVAVADDPRGRGDRRWEQRGCRRLEDVRRPGHDGSAVVPRRRAAPDDRPDGCRRERHRPVDRRSGRTARHQRGRATGRLRMGGVPDIGWRRATSSPDYSRA